MFNKEQFMLSLKSDLIKDLKPVRENLSTILAFGAIGVMAYGAYRMWSAVPEAQEEIAAKKYRDESVTKLEAVAVAAPYMAVPVGCFVAAAGMMIGSDYISRSRLAATTTLLAAAVADKKKLQEKFVQYTSQEKLQQAKKEIFEETHDAELRDENDAVIEGYDATGEEGRKKRELRLNRFYRYILEDNREFYNTPTKIEEVNKFIQREYGPKPNNNWLGAPFCKNDVTKLLGVDYGRAGNEVGWKNGEKWNMVATPAIDTKTGEVFFYLELPDTDPEWDVPFTK